MTVICPLHQQGLDIGVESKLITSDDSRASSKRPLLFFKMTHIRTNYLKYWSIWNYQCQKPAVYGWYKGSHGNLWYPVMVYYFFLFFLSDYLFLFQIHTKISVSWWGKTISFKTLGSISAHTNINVRSMSKVFWIFTQSGVIFR